MTALFRLGAVTLSSGRQSRWKIDCDALTPEDWDALAWIAVERFGAPGALAPILRGGTPFAAALQRHVVADGPLWIVDDVLTTGRSFEDYRSGLNASERRPRPLGYAGRPPLGVVVFARATPPTWVRALFTLAEAG